MSAGWAEHKTPRGFMIRDETCKLNRYKSLEAAENAFDLHEKAKGVPCGIVECTCGWWHIKPIP
jgi:hypothetical protein